MAMSNNPRVHITVRYNYVFLVNQPKKRRFWLQTYWIFEKIHRFYHDCTIFGWLMDIAYVWTTWIWFQQPSPGAATNRSWFPAEHAGVACRRAFQIAVSIHVWYHFIGKMWKMMILGIVYLKRHSHGKRQEVMLYHMYRRNRDMVFVETYPSLLATDRRTKKCHTQ